MPSIKPPDISTVLTLRLQEPMRRLLASRLADVFRDWVRSVEPAGNLIVIRTPPGSAHLVGVVLDEAAPPEIVGTICGDDTIFVACRSTAEAGALSSSLAANLA